MKGISIMRSRETLFAPARQQSRADITDRAAREIIEAETVARHQQIARLRSARLRKEAADRPGKQAAGRSKQLKQAR